MDLEFDSESQCPKYVTRCHDQEIKGRAKNEGIRSPKQPKFADNLKRELPRIPFAPDFKAFADVGKQLAELHLNYEQLEPWPLKFIEAEGVPYSTVVAGKMKLTGTRRACK